MKKYSLPLLLNVLLVLCAAVPFAHAAPNYSFEWAGKVPLSESSYNPVQSSSWFPTIAACNADFAQVKASSALYNNFVSTCSCSKAIYLQSSCPDFASANSMNAGQIPQYGACLDSSQCVTGLVCGSSHTCVTGSPASSDPVGSPSTVAAPGSNGGGTVAAPGSNSGDTVGAPGSNAGGLTNPLGFSTIPEFLTAILGLVIKIGGIVIVLMLVYIGFLFVTAQGREEKIKEAREALMWTVIGALILLGAQAIQLGIQATVSALGAGN